MALNTRSPNVKILDLNQPLQKLSISVDRQTPVTFTPEQLAIINGTTNTCNVDNTDINPTVVDATSGIAVNAISSEVEGCELNRLMRFVDDCGNGNGVEFVWKQFNPPAQNDITITLNGKICADIDDERCIPGANGFDSFADGDSIVAGAIDVELDAPAGCVTQTALNFCSPTGRTVCADCDADPDRCFR